MLQSSSRIKVTGKNFFFQDLSRIFRPFANCVFVNKLLCFKSLIIPTLEQRDNFFFQTKVFEHRSHLSDKYFDLRLRSGHSDTIRQQKGSRGNIKNNNFYNEVNWQLLYNWIINVMKIKKTKTYWSMRSNKKTKSSRKNGK